MFTGTATGVDPVARDNLDDRVCNTQSVLSIPPGCLSAALAGGGLYSRRLLRLFATEAAAAAAPEPCRRRDSLRRSRVAA